MEKRLPLAILLSFVILFGYRSLFPPPAETPAQDANGASDANIQAASQLGGIDNEGLGDADVAQAEAWSEWLLLGKAGERGHYYARFDSLGGTLTDLRVADYFTSGLLTDEERKDPSTWVRLLTSVESGGLVRGSLAMSTTPSSRDFVPGGLADVHWAHRVLRDDDGVATGVEYSHATEGGLAFKKTIAIEPGHYRLAVTFGISNPNNEVAAGREVAFVMTPARSMPRSTSDGFYKEPAARVAWKDGGTTKQEYENRSDFDEGERPDADDLSGGFPPTKDISFVGLDNKYFAVFLRGADELARATFEEAEWRKIYDEVDDDPYNAETTREGAWRVTVDQRLRMVLPAVGGVHEYQYRLYAGPKDRKIIEEDWADHGRVLDRDQGKFSSIAGVLLAILGFFKGIVGNWGVAIILLTLCVRLALFPMNRRSQTAMARHQTKMKRVQPLLDEVKERYKGNPQKLRQEQAKIMQKEGAMPPLGGCLPIFLQIPVFFGLFSALRISFDLRQAGFLWVEDLSLPDRLIRIDLSLPLVGTIEYLNILPPVMVVLWILQQKVMPKPTDEQAQRMQKMMMWMPILFGFFLYNYAAGLSIYMITSSFFGIMEYSLVRKIWPLDTTEKPKKKSGFMAKLGELQEQASKMQEEQQRQRKQPKGAKGTKKRPKNA